MALGTDKSPRLVCFKSKDVAVVEKGVGCGIHFTIKGLFFHPKKVISYNLGAQTISFPWFYNVIHY